MASTSKGSSQGLLHRRAFGVLLHPTSLPGECGSGDLGESAFRFVEFLERARASYWQMLPLGQTGHGHSPYAPSSVFAGGEHLVALDRLVADGLIDRAELPHIPESRSANLTTAFQTRYETLQKAFSKAEQLGYARAERQAFAEVHHSWLEPYCMFAALKKAQGGLPFWQWPERLARAEPDELSKVGKQLADQISFEAFVQFCFDRDLSELADYARKRGVGLIGDLPIFVAHDSADVWQSPRRFQIDPAGSLLRVAGVPPDAFSSDGQLWGNPLYDWEALARDGFSFWIDRVRHAMRYFDAIRLDHFIGFVRYWAIPRESPTAKAGAYLDGPGEALFSALKQALGPLSIIAEDLGVVTEEVTALRTKIGAPGMRVLQFSMSPDPSAETSRMHHVPDDSVVYTGTHDNDTLVGWLSGPPPGSSSSAEEEYQRERAFALAYAGQPDNASVEQAADGLLRLVFQSRALTAMVPIQDVLSLARDARMNRPGIADGNWAFRLRTGELGELEARRLHSLASMYGRLPMRHSEPEAKRASRR